MDHSTAEVAAGYVKFIMACGFLVFMAVLTLPNCPEDNNYMGFESLEVILKNKEHIVIPVHFCTRCQSYLTSYGVTKDPTEVAREFYRQNPSAGHVENVVSAKPLI